MTCDKCVDKHIWNCSSQSFDSTASGISFHGNSTIMGNTVHNMFPTCDCTCHQPVMKTRVEIEERLAVMRSITPCPAELRLMCETLEWVLGYS